MSKVGLEKNNTLYLSKVHKAFFSLLFQVLQSVIETEKAHVNEMTSVLQNYIRPINNSDM